MLLCSKNNTYIKPADNIEANCSRCQMQQVSTKAPYSIAVLLSAAHYTQDPR